MYSRIRDFFIHGSLSELTSIQDRWRLILLFNLAFAVTLMGIVSFLISLALGTYAVFVPAIGNLLFGLIMLFWIKLKRDFITAAKFY